MGEILVEQALDPPMGRRPAEFVERTGLGHPDSICDHVMDAVPVAPCRLYREAAGRILHHNVDKGLLIAGQASPRPGGGVVEAPMRIVLVALAAGAAVGDVAGPIRDLVGEELAGIGPFADRLVRGERPVA